MGHSHVSPQTVQELTSDHHQVWQELSFSVNLFIFKVFFVCLFFSVNSAGSSKIKIISFIEIRDSEHRFWITKIELVHFHDINSLYTLQKWSQIMVPVANCKYPHKHCVLSCSWNVLHWWGTRSWLFLQKKGRKLIRRKRRKMFHQAAIEFTQEPWRASVWALTIVVRTLERVTTTSSVLVTVEGNPVFLSIYKESRNNNV